MMAGYETLLVEQLEHQVLRITLNRPAVLNALSDLLVQELQTAFLAAQSWPARCIVITGAGRAFSAGADLGSRTEAAVFAPDVGTSLDRGMNPVIETLFALPIPVITAVNGVAAGAGCSLALAGDFVMAAHSASFLEAFVNIGLVPDSGATWLLPRAVGRARAMEMMMLGERVTAVRAADWGLIHRVVPDNKLAEETMDLAVRLANGPTRALGEIRQLVRRAMDGSLTEALQHERQAQSRSGMTADFNEGSTAFVEKRRPRFTGT